MYVYTESHRDLITREYYIGYRLKSEKIPTSSLTQINISPYTLLTYSLPSHNKSESTLTRSRDRLT